MNLTKTKQPGICFPEVYSEIVDEELVNVDGGLYISNTDVAIITASVLSAGTLTVATLEIAIRNQATVFAASLSRFIPCGVVVGGILVGLITSKSMDLANAFVTAMVQGKGVEIYIGQQWGFIPDLKISPK